MEIEQMLLDLMAKYPIGEDYYYTFALHPNWEVDIWQKDQDPEDGPCAWNKADSLEEAMRLAWIEVMLLEDQLKLVEDALRKMPREISDREIELIMMNTKPLDLSPDFKDRALVAMKAAAQKRQQPKVEIKTFQMLPKRED